MSGDLKKIVEYAEEFLEKSLESKIFLDLLDQAGLKIEHASKNDCLIYNAFEIYLYTFKRRLLF